MCVSVFHMEITKGTAGAAGEILLMLHYKGMTIVSQRCYNDVAMLLQQYYKVVTVYSGIPIVLPVKVLEGTAGAINESLPNTVSVLLLVDGLQH